MKILKIIPKMIILMILIISFMYLIHNNIFITYGAETKVFAVNSLVSSNKVYCIERGQHINESQYYTLAATYKIENGGNSDLDNLIACILSETQLIKADGSIRTVKLGYGSPGNGNQTESQTALYYKWNDWQKTALGNKFNWWVNNGEGQFGSTYYMPPGWYYDQKNGSGAFNTLMGDYNRTAKEYKYSIDINVWTRENRQNVIEVIRYGKKPKKIDLTVKKDWDDNNNQSGIRPNSIQVTLRDTGWGLVTRNTNGETINPIVTLSASNNWTYTFQNLNAEVYYIEESTYLTGYESTINVTGWNGEIPTGYNITNTLETITIPVTKTWDDDNNRDGKRPSSIQIALYKNGTEYARKTINVSSAQQSYNFTGLPKYYKNQKGQIVECEYTVREITEIPGYTTTITGSSTKGFKITNTHVPEKVKVQVTKIWDDDNNIDKIREPINISLYRESKKVETVTLSEDNKDDEDNNKWTYTFEDLYRYGSGKEYKYSIKEVTQLKDYEAPVIDGEKDKDGNLLVTITNKHEPYYRGHIEISGIVWEDTPNGKGSLQDGIYDPEGNLEKEPEKGLAGIKVTLKNADGTDFETAGVKYTTMTDAEGRYTFRVNYDDKYDIYKLYENWEKVQNRLNTAYVEFEYDALKYTTVATADTTEDRKADNTSKAQEDEIARKDFDETYSTASTSSKEISEEDVNPLGTIKATTKDIISFEKYEAEIEEKQDMVIKYCYGNGTYQRLNPDNRYGEPIEVEYVCTNCEETGHAIEIFKGTKRVMPNVNLGLFKREQPDVEIFSDLTKVEVKMNNQQYTYLYSVRSTEFDKESDIKIKFQNKGTYTYRRPVNPADIAYLNDDTNTSQGNKDMQVYVTYQIRLANLSSTLPITFNEIINVFDNRYEIQSATIGKTNITIEENTSEEKIYKNSGEWCKEGWIRNLNITLQPLKEANEDEKITITYKVNADAIKGLLSNEPTLNNAVEISSFTSRYGSDTTYAEFPNGGKGGRAGQLYGGYDYKAHPGNANIKLNEENNRLEAEKLEKDTDFAPSFVLYKDEPTSVSGIVWEDNKSETYASKPNERLGDGQRQDDENKVNNVKIELLELDNEGTVKKATLYKIDPNTGDIDNEDNVVYSGDEEDGKYTFKGLVTGKEYFIKYTYGNDTNEPGVKITTISGNTVNARNYKSTIITDEDPNVKGILKLDYAAFSPEQKMWPLTHNERYSVAVDNMKKRTETPSLKNGNYGQGTNMYAYTKPFIVPLEFDLTLGTTGKSDKDGTVTDSNNNEIGNILDKLDFGIIERPREALIVQKTITSFKIALTNGQVLAEGDPTTQDLSYVKTIGFKESANMDEVINSVEKRLLVEIDSELIQGAQLEATYKVKVKNNNEIDYDYGEGTDYGTEYIATNPLANYYYYGNSTGTNGEMTSTITFVDYLDKDIGQSYTDESGYWSETTDLNTLWKNGTEDRYISQEVKKELDKGEYRIFQKEGIKLGIGNTTEQEMKISKLLTSKNDHPYANHAEIIEIDGKTARTIKGFDKDNNQLVYTPGNYVPARGKSEVDDDKVDILITPPTGITNYTTTYIITGLVGLITIIVGIVFIKKKILTK